jgi:class 3 adenylate cyclase
MASVSLKSLLGKRSEAITWLQQCALETKSSFWISDDQQKILFGEQQEVAAETLNIELEGEIIGSIKGDQVVHLIAPVFNMLIKKEAERKKLGTEVLHLYQELNVIYNFSEKLTETIDPDAIAVITLEQAMHSIPTHSGVMVLWNDETKKLMVPASAGENLFDENALTTNSSVLLKIGLSGHSEIMGDLSLLKEKEIIVDEVQSVVYAAMKVKHRILGAIILAGFEKDQYTAAHLKLLVTLALQSSTAIESAMLYDKNIRAVKEREEAILRIYEVTRKFVPSEFIRLLGKDNITDVKLGDQAEKIVTVLFTDIRDFTSLSEKMTPEENFKFVSSFNERLGPVIRANNGFINQYLGDSIMAIFPGNPENALNAAIQMQKTINDLNTERKQNGLSPIRAGIGMHTGPLIMGITGDEYRMDAATISDTVNTAARIEGLTKHYKSPLLLSGDLLDHIHDKQHYRLRHLGKVQLKGKNNLLSIFECMDGYDGDILQKKLDTLSPFSEAMDLYQQQRFDAALELFQHVLDKDPEDFASLLFRENAVKYAVHGVPEDWSGAERMLFK